MTWTPVTLEGRLVRLEPLRRDHLEGLVEATEDGRMWERWYTSIPAPDGMAAAIEQRLTWLEQGFMLPFTAVRQADGAVLGMTSLYDPQWAVPRVSVGHTWNRASTHGTGTNAESKLLIMTHAFEDLGCRCVRYETSWANQQSRAAIERLGARLDGVLRGDRLESNGVLRDTVVYSVLAHEWPSVRTGLQTRVAAH
ncbi:GNAT family N-acetyltransferase [Kocuria sp.]|uniref:GNAT family N-acetyltransferase n=1 Tax=Kocuria sp. TaxID=1871328 RepID=UPI0026DABFF8|nr:GNAT family protein [Kocuria sp.]MDO4919040.1 GNAT family protein [Kocuria sp.]